MHLTIALLQGHSMHNRTLIGSPGYKSCALCKLFGSIVGDNWEKLNMTDLLANDMMWIVVFVPEHRGGNPPFMR